MKICTPHTNWIIEALDMRGLMDLIRKKETSAILDGMGREVQVVDKRRGAEPFCPLAAVSTLICGQALESAGPSALVMEHCPLCELVRRSETKPTSRATLDAEWIHGAADDVQAFAMDENLIPKPS